MYELPICTLKILFYSIGELFISLSACQRGFFEANCAKKCADNCDDCNDETGLCDQGCLPGFMGYVCQEGKSYKKSIF